MDKQIDNKLDQYLSDYLFHNVWNRPYDEYRRNIIPILHSIRPSVNNVHFSKTSLSLPTEVSGDNAVPMYIYVLPRTYMGGINIDTPSWVRLDTYLNQSDLELRIHGKNGEMLARSEIYVHNHTCENSVILAISAPMFEKIMGSGYDPADIYVAIYYDSDIANKILIYSEQITTAYERSIIFNKITNGWTDEHGVYYTADTVFLNGREAVVISEEEIRLGDYVELIVDDNIIGRFSLDLATTADRHRYYSDRDQCYKTIVHIPKSINPDNLVITHNTCDVYVRPRNVSNHNLKGLYLHRCTKSEFIYKLYPVTVSDDVIYCDEIHPSNINIGDVIYLLKDAEGTSSALRGTKYKRVRISDNSFSSDYVLFVEDKGIQQITHNDFSIPDAILDAYRQALNTTEITLHVVVRTHLSDDIGKSKTLIHDSCYIDFLYQHEDNEILLFMTGVHPIQVPFWTASILEQSGYTLTLTDFPLDKGFTSVVNEAIDVLGYYQVLSLLGHRIYHFTIPTSNYTPVHKFEIETPLLYSDISLQSIAYLNGIKLVDEYVSTAKTPEGTIVVTIDESVVFNPSDVVTIELFEAGDNSAYWFTSSNTNNTLTLPNSNFNIYEVGVVQNFINTIDNRDSFNKEFILIDPSSICTINQNADGSNTLIFNTNTYGKTYAVVCNQNRFIKVVDTVVTIDDFNLNPISSSNVENGVLKSSILKQTYAKAGNLTAVAPLLGPRTMRVYLNGRFLVRGVDWELQTTYSESSNEMFSEIIIQSVEYLSDTNRLEIYVTDHMTFTDINGFIKSNILETNSVVPYWLNGISAVVVAGFMVNVYGVNGLPLVVDAKNTNGELYCIQAILPTTGEWYVKNYQSERDTERLNIMIDYFKRRYTEEFSVEIINSSYRIYSLTSSIIIRDVLRGVKSVYYENNPELVLDQVSEYLYLRDKDIAFNSNLDLRYIDIYPSYRRNVIEGSDSYQALSVILKALLPKDSITDNEAINE